MSKRFALLFSLCVLLLGASPAYVGVGSTLEPFSLEDQHGELRAVDADVRVVLFSREMKGGGIVKEALADDGGRFLESHGAVYVADVSGMPGLIRRIFAIPGMRKRPYDMLLDTEGTTTAAFPNEEGRPTLLALDRLRVVAIEYPDAPGALREAVERLARRK